MSLPSRVPGVLLVNFRNSLDSLGSGTVAKTQESRAQAISASSLLDPLAPYPHSHGEGSALEHTVSLLDDYFHGADVGEDEETRAVLFHILGNFLERLNPLERNAAWVVPRLTKPMLADRNWNTRINPAGIPYAKSFGSTLAPSMPRDLADFLLNEDVATLGDRMNTQWPNLDPAWHQLKEVSPEYLGLIVQGARPVLSRIRLLETVAPAPPPSSSGPRL